MTDRALNGLILAGGKSLRMGRAKAHLSFGQGPQWQACESVLRPFCQKIYFSVSKKLEKPLPVPKEQLIADIFIEPIGPLGGILSAFKSFPEEAFFVLACDLPFFYKEAASFLLEKRNPHKKATAFFHDGNIEPLCAIYEPSILSDLAVFWARGIYCPRVILSKVDVEQVKPLEQRWLVNINHAHEYEAMKPATKTEKTVVIHYYASLREQAHCANERLTTAAESVGELFYELKKKYAFAMELPFLRFAKNNRLVLGDEPIMDEDEIVFIPPVSGG